MSKFYTRFNPQPCTGVDFDGVESLTQSQFADQCDINFMLARLQRGDTSVLRDTGLMYADISSLPEDLQSALELQKRARQAFSPELEKRFGRVENFLDFVSDSANREEAIKLGLIDVPVSESPMKVEVVNPALSGANPNPSAGEPVLTT